MITPSTPPKLVELIHDTWPQLFRPPADKAHRSWYSNKDPDANITSCKQPLTN